MTMAPESALFCWPSLGVHSSDQAKCHVHGPINFTAFDSNVESRALWTKGRSIWFLLSTGWSIKRLYWKGFWPTMIPWLHGFIFLNNFIQAIYLHSVTWLIFEYQPVSIFSNGITLQTRAWTEKNHITNCYGFLISKSFFHSDLLLRSETLTYYIVLFLGGVPIACPIF